MCTLLRRFVKENKSLLQPSADTARHFLARRVGCTSRQVDCSSRAQLDEIGPDTRIEKKRRGAAFRRGGEQQGPTFAPSPGAVYWIIARIVLNFREIAAEPTIANKIT